MQVNQYWEWTRQELQELSRRNSTLRPISANEFGPGDVAYVEDSLHLVFTEFLRRKQYRLTLSEDVVTPSKGRYCVVIRRISSDKYIICCCATYGGARGFQDLADPVARHFGVPLNQNTIWPGTAPLTTLPPWKSDKGAFVLAIPVIREGLIPSNINHRIRLRYPDLQRLKGVIDDRSQSFDRHAAQIRSAYAVHRRSKRGEMPLRSPLVVNREFTENQLADLELQKEQSRWRLSKRPKRLTLPHVQNLAWLLRKGVFDRSVYLNSELPRKRPILEKLPKPFFVSTLRTSLSTIKRLLRVR